MAEKKSSIPPEIGENPSLSPEELEALRAAGNGIKEENKINDMAALTGRLLERNLTGSEVEIQAGDETQPEAESGPDSMPPERLKRTNRPPDAGIYSDIARSILKPGEKDDAPPTKKVAYSVEEDKE